MALLNVTLCGRRNPGHGNDKHNIGIDRET